MIFVVLNIIAAFVMISIITPYFIIVWVALSVIYMYFIKKYLLVARDMRRVWDNLRTPLISIFTEICMGL